MMDLLWTVLVFTSYCLQLAFGSPIRNSEIYPHDGSDESNSHLVNWEPTSLYAAVPAVALIIAAFSFVLGCTWCYRHKDCKLFTASVSRIQDVALPVPAAAVAPDPVNNNVSEDNNNGPISLREMQNIANNNATAYIVSENEERNRAVSRESVVEFEPLPAALGVQVDPLERCRDWFVEEDFPRDRLQYLREIGRGWFGRIVIGEVDNGDSRSTVAVKILNQNAAPEEKARFLDEAKLYRDLRHDHLLTYIGRCLHEDPWIVVFELCPIDLQQYLALNRPKMAILNEGGVPLKIACDVTSALAYLHSRGYVYGLVWCGCVRVRGEGEGARGVLGQYCAHPPLGHLAAPDQTVTSMSDVWSLGAFLWELCSWSPAPLAPLAEPALPCPYRQHLYQVMQLCWNLEPSSRPSASQVHALVAHLEADLQANRTHAEIANLEDFEQRWNSLKPNSIPVVDEVPSRSQSLTTLRGSLEDVSESPLAPWIQDLVVDSHDDASYYRDVSDVIMNLDNILNEENTSSSESSHQPSPARDNLNLDCKKAVPVQSSLVKSPGITNFQNIMSGVDEAIDNNDICAEEDIDRDTIETLSHSFGRHNNSQSTLANLTPDTPNEDINIFNELKPPDPLLDIKDKENSEDINQIFDKESINDAEMPNKCKDNISFKNNLPKLRELCLASIPRLSENEQINISKDCETSCDIEKDTVTDTHECIFTKSVDNVVISQDHKNMVTSNEENKCINEKHIESILNSDSNVAMHILNKQTVIYTSSSNNEEKHLTKNMSLANKLELSCESQKGLIIEETDTKTNLKDDFKNDELTKDFSYIATEAKSDTVANNTLDENSYLQLRDSCVSFLDEIIAESLSIVDNTLLKCSHSQSNHESVSKLDSEALDDTLIEDASDIGAESVISFRVINEEVISTASNEKTKQFNNHKGENINDNREHNIDLSPGLSRHEEIAEKSASESFNGTETLSTVPIDSKPNIVQINQSVSRQNIKESFMEEPKPRSDNTTNESTVYMDLIDTTNTQNISKDKILDDKLKKTIKTCVDKPSCQNSFIQIEFDNESTVYLDLPSVKEDTNRLLNSERGTTNFDSNNDEIITSTPKLNENNDDKTEIKSKVEASKDSSNKESNVSNNVSPFDSPTKSHPTDTYDENSSVLLGPFENTVFDHYKPISSEENDFPKEEVLAFSSNFSEINLATPSPLHDVNFLNEVPDLDSQTEFNFNNIDDNEPYTNQYVKIVEITDLDKPHMSPSTPPNSPGNFLASTSSKYLVDEPNRDSASDPSVHCPQESVDLNQIDLQMTTKLAMAENENNINIEYSGPFSVDDIVSEDTLTFNLGHSIPDANIVSDGGFYVDEPRVELTLDDDAMKALRNELELKLPLAQISSIEPTEETVCPFEVVLNYCGALSPICEETDGQLERYENDTISQAANTSKINDTISSESYLEPCDNSTDEVTDLLTAANQTFTIHSNDLSPNEKTYTVNNDASSNVATLTMSADSLNEVKNDKTIDQHNTTECKNQPKPIVESTKTPVDDSTYNLIDKLSDCERLSQVSPFLVSPTTDSSRPNSENATAFSTQSKTTMATDAKADTTKNNSPGLSKATSIDSWCSNDTLFNVEDTFDDLAEEDCQEQEHKEERDDTNRTLTDHEDDKDDSRCSTYIVHDSKSDGCDSLSSDSPTGHGTYTKLKDATASASVTSEPNKDTQTKDLAYVTLMSGVSHSNCTTEVISSLDWNLPQPELVRRSPCTDDVINITQEHLFDNINQISNNPVTAVEKTLNKIESVDLTCLTDNPTEYTSMFNSHDAKTIENDPKNSPDFHLKKMTQSLQSTPLITINKDNVEPITIEPFVASSNVQSYDTDMSTNLQSFFNLIELRPQDIESLANYEKDLGQNTNSELLLEAESRSQYSIKDHVTALSPTYSEFVTLAVNQSQDINTRPNDNSSNKSAEYAAFEICIQNKPQDLSSVQNSNTISKPPIVNPAEDVNSSSNDHGSSNSKDFIEFNRYIQSEPQDLSISQNVNKILSETLSVNESENLHSKSNENVSSNSEEFAGFEKSIQNKPQDLSSLHDTSTIFTNTLAENQDENIHSKINIHGSSNSENCVRFKSYVQNEPQELSSAQDKMLSKTSVVDEDVNSSSNDHDSRSNSENCNELEMYIQSKPQHLSIGQNSNKLLSETLAVNESENLHSRSNENGSSISEELAGFETSIQNKPQDLSNAYDTSTILIKALAEKQDENIHLRTAATNIHGSCNSKDCVRSESYVQNEPQDLSSVVDSSTIFTEISTELLAEDVNLRSNKNSSNDIGKNEISIQNKPRDFFNVYSSDPIPLQALESTTKPFKTLNIPKLELPNSSHNDLEDKVSNLSGSDILFTNTASNVLIEDNTIYESADAYEQPHSIIMTENLDQTFDSHEGNNSSYVSHHALTPVNKAQTSSSSSIDIHFRESNASKNDTDKITLDTQDKLDKIIPETQESTHNLKDNKISTNTQDNNERERLTPASFLSDEIEQLSLIESTNQDAIIKGFFCDQQSQSTTMKTDLSQAAENNTLVIDGTLSTLTENFLKSEQHFSKMNLLPRLLNDIRLMGSGSEMLSTSFTEDSPTEETAEKKPQDEDEKQNGIVNEIVKEWDSDSDGSNSSSGEFIWKDGDGFQIVLTTSPMYEHNRDGGRERNTPERCGGEGAESDAEEGDDGEEGDEVEFVPSSWDCRAEPSKSSLRTLARQHSQDKKRVVFKREKYHCVYEYPREVAVECDTPALMSHYTTYADWDAASAEEAELAYGQLYGDHPLDLYSLRSGVLFGNDYDDDFFISSSARPFEPVGLMSSASQFFPGMKPPPPSSLDFTTPDSGVEDVLTPAAAVEPTAWNGDSCSSSESVSPASEMGGLRHTRDRLKLDLPPSPLVPAPSPRSPRHARVFNFEPHTFSTFGKTAHTDTAHPQHVEQVECSGGGEETATSTEVKLQDMKGEGTILDSGDEDSGIESSSKASLDRNKESPDHIT